MATGSIQVRTAINGDTSFRLRWDRGIDPATGARRQGSETVADPATGRTLRVPAGADRTAARGPWPTAMAKVWARLATILAGDEPPDAARITLADFLRHWLQITDAGRLPATHKTYRSAIELHLVPKLGAVRLAKLTTLDIEGFLAGQRAKGLAASTVGGHKMVLDMALGQAVRWKLLQINPCDNLVRTARRGAARSVAQVWTAAELRAFLGVADRSPDAALWRLLAASGLRIGEALALQWDAIDWEGGAVAVARTLSRGRDGRVMPREGTKSGRSRTVPLDPVTVAAIRRHRRDQRVRIVAAPRWDDPSLVFPSARGAVYQTSEVGRRFHALCQDAGVPRIRMHDLRHTHATMLLLAGVHPKIVSERLGHAQIAITMDLYSHVIPGMQDGAVAAIGDALGGTLDAA